MKKTLTPHYYKLYDRDLIDNAQPAYMAIRAKINKSDVLPLTIGHRSALWHATSLNSLIEISRKEYLVSATTTTIATFYGDEQLSRRLCHAQNLPSPTEGLSTPVLPTAASAKGANDFVFSPRRMNVIEYCEKQGFDTKLVSDPRFNDEEAHILKIAMDIGGGSLDHLRHGDPLLDLKVWEIQDYDRYGDRFNFSGGAKACAPEQSAELDEEWEP